MQQCFFKKILQVSILDYGWPMITLGKSLQTGCCLDGRLPPKYWVPHEISGNQVHPAQSSYVCQLNKDRNNGAVQELIHEIRFGTIIEMSHDTFYCNSGCY